MPTVSVTRTYLQQLDPAELRAPARSPAGARVEPVPRLPAAFFRWLYATVGGPWHWFERREWSDETIREHLGQPTVFLRVLYVEGAPAGYYELNRHADGSVEVVHIGLVPDRIGQGLGWVPGVGGRCGTRGPWAPRGSGSHTCTLDGEAALPNYLRRGFVPYKTEEYEVELPADAAG